MTFPLPSSPHCPPTRMVTLIGAASLAGRRLQLDFGRSPRLHSCRPRGLSDRERGNDETSTLHRRTFVGIAATVVAVIALLGLAAHVRPRQSPTRRALSSPRRQREGQRVLSNRHAAGHPRRHHASPSPPACASTRAHLYVTNSTPQVSGSVSTFDKSAPSPPPRSSGYNNPESCTPDASGNIFVGNAGAGKVLKFDPSGTLLATYTVTVQNRGADWITLSSDQCTLYYTSEGTLVKRFNVCTNTQLTDFATLPSNNCFASSLRPNGEMLVACNDAVYRLDTSARSLRPTRVCSALRRRRHCSG